MAVLKCKLCRVSLPCALSWSQRDKYKEWRKGGREGGREGKKPFLKSPYQTLRQKRWTIRKSRAHLAGS
jgi:hypothetical protein